MLLERQGISDHQHAAWGIDQLQLRCICWAVQALKLSVDHLKLDKIHQRGMKDALENCVDALVYSIY